MTTLFAPCDSGVGVARGTPQEVRLRRSTPAKSETWHFFILTTFAVLDLIWLKIASYMTVNRHKRYIAVQLLRVESSLEILEEFLFGWRFSKQISLNCLKTTQLESISN
jgi:hypothetical protein